GIGGTIQHVLRIWRAFFLMDVIPISVLALMVSIYLWIRLGPKIQHLLSMLAALALIQAFGFWQLPRHWAINVSYALLGLLVLIPVAVVLIRTRFREVGWIATALVAFGDGLFWPTGGRGAAAVFANGNSLALAHVRGDCHRGAERVRLPPRGRRPSQDPLPLTAEHIGQQRRYLAEPGRVLLGRRHEPD